MTMHEITRRRHTTSVLVATLAVALVLAACGGDAAPDTTVTLPPADPTAASTTEASQQASGIPDDAGGTITIGESELGPILADGDGLTLYIYDLDDGGEAACTGRCADTWPPVESPVAAGDGIDATLLGATTGEAGAAQVTFNGRPLYRYTGDTVPGDIAGQGVDEQWWAVSPAGIPVSLD